jgi:hypothetical protein
MQQLEIDYFWPLTEQIPLDLNYTDFKKPQAIKPIKIGGALTDGAVATWGINDKRNVTFNISAGRLQLDVDTTVIKLNTKPPLIRRWLYKLLGLKWRIK